MEIDILDELETKIRSLVDENRHLKKRNLELEKKTKEAQSAQDAAKETIRRLGEEKETARRRVHAILEMLGDIRIPSDGTIT